MALGDRKLLADRVAEVENVDQFFNEAYECFEHGIAPWGWGDWEGGRVSTGLPAWISRRSTPHAEASGELEWIAPFVRVACSAIADNILKNCGATMKERLWRAGLIFLLLGMFGSATAQPTQAIGADAMKVASAVLGLASLQKETKQSFAQRVGPAFRRLVAIETMTGVVFGPAWRTMPTSQQAEAIELYSLFVMRTLQGFYEAVLPSQFGAATGEMLRSKPGSVTVIQITCLRLNMADCIYYSAKSQAGEHQIELQLLYIDGKWRVVEMKIAGLYLQQTYLSVFRSNINSSSVERLLEHLRARVNS
ncbi:Toluene tolerance, Ttg2 [Achromobacter denitrificans]|uniref:ABC transporter substrate-binding protein n=2 Tax=Achromobacter denitrificans TaxID=32002 RepID=UPI000B1A7B88|nr:ABC transporter substrate-binding protein [Achromobacter denitrificans]MDX3877058.1 ABC transporter substrate-binding protein [Achromobacter sp.]QKH42476.1 ABC transporter substrate-binding protein [Achromobacter denitrificans]QKH50380.1 ABC transporter substrate-binding protein [Achromobacter denitrificans]CAB3662608.1 hypothetical protein LMG1231_00628 [Achromobacter denitrificans]SUU20416.1 Toluene tolerance, Ttg2 [Achromobacter denitrificans]